MKPIVILESDPFAVAALADMLRAEGYDVMDVSSENSLLQILEQLDVGAVFLDGDPVDWSARDVVGAIRAISSETAIVITGDDQNSPGTKEAFKAGANAFLQVPAQADDARKLLMRLAPIIRGEVGASTGFEGRPGASTPTASRGQRGLFDETPDHLAPPLRQALSDFLNVSLQTFMALERRTMEARQELLKHQNPSSVRKLDRILRCWIAHPDEQFITGFKQLEGRTRTEVVHAMRTGGEVLDRLGSSRADLVILSDDLPDIPHEVVTESIHASDPGVALLVIRKWGTDDRSGELLHQGAEPHRTSLKDVNDLINIIDLTRARVLAADMGREFVATFRKTHDDFLQRYTALRHWLDQES